GHSVLAQARAGSPSGLQGQRFDSLEAIKKAAAIRPSPELRDEAIACMALPDFRIGKQWDDGLRSDLNSIHFDSKLELYTELKPDGNLSIRREKDQQEWMTEPTQALRVNGVHGFSLDGNYLALSTKTQADWIWYLER